jgi:hypothetical protein
VATTQLVNVHATSPKKNNNAEGKKYSLEIRKQFDCPEIKHYRSLAKVKHIKAFLAKKLYSSNIYPILPHNRGISRKLGTIIREKQLRLQNFWRNWGVLGESIPSNSGGILNSQKQK